MSGRKILAFAALIGASVALAPAAQASFGGGGGDGGANGGGDFAVRAELQNPGFIEPGSPYGYYRSYSQGPGYPSPVWVAPPSSQPGYGVQYRPAYRPYHQGW